ncbi:MAG: hypothetical protein LLG37_08005 [Spirochaetia bacterium]|nr:hypothetical protein [Spirochaetia bacterium]
MVFLLLVNMVTFAATAATIKVAATNSKSKPSTALVAATPAVASGVL